VDSAELAKASWVVAQNENWLDACMFPIIGWSIVLKSSSMMPCMFYMISWDWN